MKITIVIMFVFLAVLTLFSFEEYFKDDDWKAPKSSKEMPNPLLKWKDNESMNKMGKKQYQLHCSTCHGDAGIGDGISGRYLGVQPADLTIKEFYKQTDGEIYWKISTGRSPMPAFDELLSEKKIWIIINYLRTIQK